MNQIMPIVAGQGDRSVGILIYDGLCLFEFSLAAEVFGPRQGVGDDWYSCAVASVTGSPVSTGAGLQVSPDRDLGLLAEVATIVVPGWPLASLSPPPALLAALTNAHRRGARIVSICSGSFLLAQCGLLDGRRATTHWLYADLLQERHPAVEVDASVLYVDEGSVLTSAGSAAGIDLCLHIVRSDFGAAMANAIARRLVVATHRDGGQRQFVERPVPRDHDGGRLGAVIAGMRADLHLPMRISDLARAAGMSERTFIRRFNATTGMAPGRWILQERVNCARDLLESSAAPLDEVARLSGFSGATALRHHFRRQVQIGPADYRKSFAQRA